LADLFKDLHLLNTLKSKVCINPKINLELLLTTELFPRKKKVMCG
jgi:hypothetical protein